MRLPHFQCHSPRTLNSLLKLQKKLKENAIIMAGGTRTLNSLLKLQKKLKENAIIMAGGTELLNMMRLRLIKPEHIISLSNIKGLNRISATKDKTIEIGSTSKLTHIASFFEKSDAFRAVYEAAIQVGSQQIRNMATIGGNILQDTRCMFYNRSREWQKIVPPCHKRGGNICHAVKNSKKCFAVYQGDMAPALMVFMAKAVFFTPYGIHEMPIEKLFSGESIKPFSIGENSILVSIKLPHLEKGLFSTYKKYRIRGGLDFPLAGLAVALSKDGDTIINLRLCLTGIASQPIMVNEAEKTTQGKILNEALIEKVAQMAYRTAHPVANLEDSPEKRRFVIRQMVYDSLKEAIKK